MQRRRSGKPENPAVTLSRNEISLRPCIHGGRLTGIGDRVWLRDARARSGRPSLAAAGYSTGGSSTGGNGASLEVRGPFSIIQRFVVKAEEGRNFARASRDENPIHTEGSIVPGAMIAARAILLPEIIVGQARVRKARIRFRAPARYGLPMVNLYRIEPVEGDSLRVELQVRQEGTEVAEGQLLIDVGPPTTLPRSSPRAVSVEGQAEAARIRGFLRSLQVDPAHYLERAGPVYPRAFLAALPSGEMVRQFSGEGGILNALDLEFQEGDASLGATPPTVELQGAPRQRKSFNKILARIIEGVQTCCSGFAMVLSREGAPGLSPGI